MLLSSYFFGEGGIRTLDTVSRMPVFETGAFDHSATSPCGEAMLRRDKRTRCPLAKSTFRKREKVRKRTDRNVKYHTFRRLKNTLH